MKIIGQIFIISLVLAIILTIIIWSDSRDKKVMEEMDKYEACVKAEYGVLPANWYAEHGEYPKCP